MGLLVRILAAGTVSLVSIAATAQEPEQTPERAQAFIDKVVTAGGVKIEGNAPFWGQGYSVGRFTSSGSYRFEPGNLISYKMGTSVCLANVSGYAHYGTLENRGDYVAEAKNPLFFALNQVVSINLFAHEFFPVSHEVKGAIDWAGVASVSSSGPQVEITRRDQHNLRLTLPTADLATRVAFAMEVVRVNCDPTADSAF